MFNGSLHSATALRTSAPSREEPVVFGLSAGPKVTSACIYVCLCGTYIRIYGHALRGPPPTPPQMVWEAAPLPPSCGVGSGGVDWEFPSLLLLPGRLRAGKSWFPGGREASLLRQTIFCGRRFCSDTLGCLFKCFGRPWRFLSGIIQYRAIQSVHYTLYTI